MLAQWLETPVGQLRAVWSAEGRLFACAFATADEGPSTDNMPASDEEYACEARDRIAADRPGAQVRDRQLQLRETFAAYFLHGELQWDLEWLDWSATSPFHQRVLRACYEIPAGQTMTYAQLADRVGHPRAARAVGTAMARNRWPILIPCHRVVGATGKLTGYSGTGGLLTKRWLLDLELGTRTLHVS
jgi:methylated-DNA-[protein]-cysteine S-methyltransferase